METITFTVFRKNASEYLSRVEKGEKLTVLRHGRPIAEIRPFTKDDPKILSWRKPRLKLIVKGAGLSKAILEEREF